MVDMEWKKTELMAGIKLVQLIVDNSDTFFFITFKFQVCTLCYSIYSADPPLISKAGIANAGP